MSLLKAVFLITFLIAGVLSLGIASSFFVKPQLVEWGLRFNWAWPALAMVGSFFFNRSTGVRFSWLDFGPLRTVNSILFGMTIGVGLQVAFWGCGLRRSFIFQGILILPVIYQCLAASAEEALFRGSFQTYLSRYAPFSSARWRSLFSALLISIPFGIIHGLNPVIFSASGFDFMWFLGTFSLSFAAGAVYAFRPCLLAPIGTHMGYNLIAVLF